MDRRENDMPRVGRESVTKGRKIRERGLVVRKGHEQKMQLFTTPSHHHAP